MACCTVVRKNGPMRDGTVSEYPSSCWETSSLTGDTEVYVVTVTSMAINGFAFLL